MRAQTGEITERSAACLASVESAVRDVDASVSIESALLTEALLAAVARKWFVDVNNSVSSEMSRLRERLATRSADVRFDAAVVLGVTLEIGSATVRLMAQLTLVRLCRNSQF